MQNCVHLIFESIAKARRLQRQDVVRWQSIIGFVIRTLRNERGGIKPPKDIARVAREDKTLSDAEASERAGNWINGCCSISQDVMIVAIIVMLFWETAKLQGLSVWIAWILPWAMFEEM